MSLFLIGNARGRTTSIRLESHVQHIWNESEAHVSARVKARVITELGPGPYTNPEGHFGQSQKVFLVTKG